MSSQVEVDHPAADPASLRCRTVADVAERLMAKYEATLSLALISSTVRATARSVGRFASSAARAETILRASDERLASIAATAS